MGRNQGRAVEGREVEGVSEGEGAALGSEGGCRILFLLLFDLVKRGEAPQIGSNQEEQAI